MIRKIVKYHVSSCWRRFLLSRFQYKVSMPIFAITIDHSIKWLILIIDFPFGFLKFVNIYFQKQPELILNKDLPSIPGKKSKDKFFL